MTSPVAVAAKPVAMPDVLVAERPVAVPLASAADATPAFIAAPKPAAEPRVERSADLTDALVEPFPDELTLLDLLDRLPAAAAQAARATKAVDAVGNDSAMAINLQGCSMDELWLGDFELEDPRRLSLAEKAGQAVTALLQAIALRLGFGRHQRIGYRGRAPIAA